MLSTTVIVVTGVRAEGEWLVVWTGAAAKSARVAALTGVADLATAEGNLGIGPGTPIFVRPDLTLDVRLCRFVQRSDFRQLALDTRRSYALDLRLFFSFLWGRGQDWHAATPDDVLDYEEWRRRHPDNPATVGGAKWIREFAALRKLYRWAVAQRIVETDPTDGISKPKSVRSTRVRWLTPRALRLWKQVGLLGYDTDGLPVEGWDGSVADRNGAFVDLVYASGLRAREAGSLLVMELPRPLGPQLPGMSSSFVASACAKGGRRRQFWATPMALRAVEGYVSTSRRLAVRFAQEHGTYDKWPAARRVVSSSSTTGVLNYVDARGRKGQVNIDALDPAQRHRYLINGPDGPEPMLIWLDEHGHPIAYRSWTENVFPSANKACAAFGLAVHASPHMLRHSFALRMLVALEYALASRSGMTPEERRREDMLLGSPFDLVRDLLGHASTLTTRRHYLEPLAGLRIDHLLGTEDEDDLRRVISRIAERSPLVQDVPEVFGPAVLA